MSDASPAADPADADPGTDPGEGGPGTDPGPDDGKNTPPPDPQAEIKKWKAMARKHEANAKANADAAQQLQEIKHAGKSETEKLQALLAEEQNAAKEARIQALKLQVANERELPPGLAKFLPDLEDEVDMIEAADELLAASRDAGTATQPTRQTPKSTLTNPLGDDDPAASREALINSMVGRSPF